MTNNSIVERILGLKEQLSISEGIVELLHRQNSSKKLPPETQKVITSKIANEKQEQDSLIKEITKLSSYLAYLEKKQQLKTSKFVIRFPAFDFFNAIRQLKFINDNRIAVIDKKCLHRYIFSEHFEISLTIDFNNIAALTHTLSGVEHFVEKSDESTRFVNFQNTILSRKRIAKTSEMLNRIEKPRTMNFSEY